MLEKLQELEKKFFELEKLLAKKETTLDPNFLKKCVKEHGELEPIINEFQNYKDLTKQLEETKKMLDDASDSELRQMINEEIKTIEAKISNIEEKLKIMLLPKDPNDEKNIFMEIRSGTGGEEAALFAGELFRMYSRYAERKKWKIEIIDASPTELGGFKEIIFLISGKGAYSKLKYEGGTHRVQRVPKTESGGRIHTSAATVAVLPEAEEIEIKIEDKDLRIDTFRSSGPGGQNVNKTSSAVRITHIPTGIVVACQEERSQHQNKAKAMALLRAKLFEIESQKQKKEITDARRSMVGSGDRSEKIRTYNFPQNRVTDHRIKYTTHNLSAILDGELDELIENLQKADISARLQLIKKI